MESDPIVGLEHLGITAAEAEVQFDVLQKKLVPLWKIIGDRHNDDAQTVVVVPSLSIDTDASGARLQAFEERSLFALFLLAKPRLRLIYVTSQTILPSIIEYYLGLLPRTIPSHAKSRLHLITPLDGSGRPLSEKLLKRPLLIERIQSLIPDRNLAHLFCYNTTYLERNLALRLDIPLYGADPRFFGYGTKSGSREVFEAAGVSYPIGRENVADKDGVLSSILQLRKRKPGLRQVIVKLNEGVAGGGNAEIDLATLPLPGTPEEEEALRGRLNEMHCERPNFTPDQFFSELPLYKGVVEEKVGAGAKLVSPSPSVQMRVTPLGQVEMLSTHDQLLGGTHGQSYLGCKFPAESSYAPLITAEAKKIGDFLAKAGVVGRFAVDFVVVQENNGNWSAYAIEINLRKGGTTHPFLTVQFLTAGEYDSEKAIFTAPSGKQKHFLATDHLESPDFRTLSPDELFDIVLRHRLHYGQVQQKGIVFHMHSAVGETGRIGMTAIADTAEEAKEIYDKAETVLKNEARSASLPLPM